MIHDTLLPGLLPNAFLPDDAPHGAPAAASGRRRLARRAASPPAHRIIVLFRRAWR